MRYLKLILLIAGLFLIINGCKKYPENTLWYRNPKKVSPFYGHLQKYTVNGIDSLDLLNLYIGNANGIVKDIRKATFNTSIEGGAYVSKLNFGSSGLDLIASFQYSDNAKKIRLSCKIRDTSIFKKILFDPNSEWLITQINCNNKPFKAKTVLQNGNIYEIQIGD